MSCTRKKVKKVVVIMIIIIVKLSNYTIALGLPSDSIEFSQDNYSWVKITFMYFSFYFT